MTAERIQALDGIGFECETTAVFRSEQSVVWINRAMQVLYTDGKPCRIFIYLCNKIVCRVLSYGTLSSLNITEATAFIRGTATRLLADNGCDILHPIILRKHVISRVKSRRFRLDESRQRNTNTSRDEDRNRLFLGCSFFPLLFVLTSLLCPRPSY